MAKDKPKKTKRIVKAKIDFISLCPRGANTFSTIYKADDGNTSVTLDTVCKDMNEQGEIIALVYAPETVDSQGDIASAAVIKEFAHDFAKNGEGIDVRHNEDVLSKDAVYVAESFIVQKDDPRFADMKDYDGNSVDATGGWGVVLKVDDEGIRKDYREGKWQGVSMGGVANKKEDVGAMIAKAVKDGLSSLSPFKKENKSKKNTENIMPLTKEDKAEIAELVKETVTSVNKEAEEAKAEALKKAQEDKPKLGLGMDKPILKANPSPEDRTRHLKNLEIFELSKTVDPDDARAMYAFEEKAQEIAKSEDLKKTMQKQSSDSYDCFYTNQETDEIHKASDGVMDPIAKALKGKNDKADEKK